MDGKVVFAHLELNLIANSWETKEQTAQRQTIPSVICYTAATALA